MADVAEVNEAPQTLQVRTAAGLSGDAVNRKDVGHPTQQGGRKQSIERLECFFSSVALILLVLHCCLVAYAYVRFGAKTSRLQRRPVSNHKDFRATVQQSFPACLQLDEASISSYSALSNFSSIDLPTKIPPYSCYRDLLRRLLCRCPRETKQLRSPPLPFQGHCG